MNTSLGAIPQMLYCNNGSGRGGFPERPVKVRADMKWFRSNIRLGSRLALLALAIQFLLSFGHFHERSAQAASASMDAKRPGLHHRVAVAPSWAHRIERRRPTPEVLESGPVEDLRPYAPGPPRRRLRDLRRDGAGQYRRGCGAAFAAVAPCDRILLFGCRRMVRRTELGACRIPAARSADGLTSTVGMGVIAPVSAVSWSFPAFRTRFDWLDACVTT